MDPAFAITSPFRNEAKALDGVLDHAIADVTSSSVPMRWAASSTSTSAAPAHAPRADTASGLATSGQTPCMLCGTHPTAAVVPTDGIYTCATCHAEQMGAHAVPRSFPAGTFECCPASTDEGDGGVLRCASCRNWYHCRCVGLQDGPLKDYACLSITQWYCPNESCCLAVLQSHARTKR